MKPKHQHLTAATVLILSVCTAIGYAIYRFQLSSPDIVVASPPKLSQISVPKQQDISAMRKLAPRFEELSYPNESTSEAVALEVFGYRRPGSVGSQTGGYQDEATERLDYALTFTFSSGSRRFCIIDGSFYPQGGLLPDGARIVRIDAHKVLVRKKERQVWIPLAAPDVQTISKKPSEKTDAGG